MFLINRDTIQSKMSDVKVRKIDSETLRINYPFIYVSWLFMNLIIKW